MWAAATLPLAAAIVYSALVARQHYRGRAWSGWRTALFLSGSAGLLLGVSPRLLPFPPGDFRQHMVAHLLVAMLAPLGLVLGAPLTLLLRNIPANLARALTALLRMSGTRLLTHPAVALALNLGGMAALYFTPLYNAMMVRPALQGLVHAHFIAAGCLYTWVIAGPDPAPRRPSVPARLVVLGLAIVAHSVFAQLLYAGWHVAATIPAAQRERGAEMMYYGGDVTELLLAFALVSTWRPARLRAARPVDAVAHPLRP